VTVAAADATKIDIPAGDRNYLARYLVSGADFSYPAVAAQQKQGGVCNCVMYLARDGSVHSLRLVKSTGHRVLDEHVLAS
jgi:outer membrane biosynthesis protein TonB